MLGQVPIPNIQISPQDEDITPRKNCCLGALLHNFALPDGDFLSSNNLGTMLTLNGATMYNVAVMGPHRYKKSYNKLNNE